MIISLDMSSDVPIYLQLRNQIVTGIGKGELRAGDPLPSVRQMARDAGINTMTARGLRCCRRDSRQTASGRSWRRIWSFCPRKPA